jgi:polyhydroxybutyrate depolymerase
MPAILFHGTADEIVPYAGGASRRFDYPFPYIPDFAARWAARNGCNPEPETLPATQEMTGVRYTNCTNNAEVVFYTVHGGGHAWPGGSALPRWIVGHTTHDMSATEAMWAFYKRFTLKA